MYVDRNGGYTYSTNRFCITVTGLLHDKALLETARDDSHDA